MLGAVVGNPPNGENIRRQLVVTKETDSAVSYSWITGS
jgi:hypothetical protein